MKLIYISGKITDETRAKELANMARFNEMEKKLRRAGHTVFNPASIETPGWTWEMYLARDLHYLVTHRPMMYFMQGWQDSRGARLEFEFAKLLGLVLIFEEFQCHTS